MSEKALNNLLKPLVEDLGFEFVGLEYHPHPKNAVVRVYIDSEKGIAIEDCEQVSREAAALLDVEDPVKSHYNLEISSPGLDRPLFTAEQFAEHQGQTAKVTLFAPMDGRRKFRGEILGASESSVNIDQDGVPVTLEMGNITKARLVPDYDRILAGED